MQVMVTVGKDLSSLDGVVQAYTGNSQGIYNTKVIFLHSLLLYLDTIANTQPTFHSISYKSL